MGMSPKVAPRTQLRFGTRGEILRRAYMQDRITTADFEKATEALMRLNAWDQQCPSMLDWAHRLRI